MGSELKRLLAFLQADLATAHMGPSEIGYLVVAFEAACRCIWDPIVTNPRSRQPELKRQAEVPHNALQFSCSLM